MEIARPLGMVTAAEIETLRRLVGDVLGREPVAGVPFAAPLLLFSRMDAAGRDALFAATPGRVLVQEQSSIEGARRLVAGEPVLVRARVVEPSGDDGPFLIEADLVDPAGDPITTVRAGMRRVAAASLAVARGLPRGRIAAAEATSQRTTRPITADLVERWVRLVGDDNPIHVDADHAARLGLTGAVVPGALLAALAEDLVAGMGPGAPVRLNLRFAAPIPVGTAVEVDIRPRPAPEGATRRDLRLFFAVGDRIAAVADLTVA